MAMTQKQALDVLKLGFNVFLTGAAGSGKTFVLNQYIDYLKKNSVRAGITASTGIAATHIGGMTIHSWAGIGVKDSLSQHDIDKITSVPANLKRIREAKVLIIDEVSMLHGSRLDSVDEVTRACKEASKPFGGLQVVLCGDLFQLPPVTRRGEDVDWVFNSRGWLDLRLKVCYLSEQHRQDDSTLLDLLNSIRSSDLNSGHYELLNERIEQEPSFKDETLTKLYTHNVDVEMINQQSLEHIDLPAKNYQMTSKGSKRNTEILASNCLAPQELELKIGAEVMFVANNFAEGYANGTRGRVLDFDDDDQPIVITTDGATITPAPHTWQYHDGEKVRAEVTQVPLRLAWAITVHKSQGMSLDKAEIDLSKAFEPGMGYVALSRVKTMEGLYIKSANNRALEVHPIISRYDNVLQTQSGLVADALDSMPVTDLEQKHKHVKNKLSDSIDLEYDTALFEELRLWRKRTADENSVPAFVILADKTIKAISAKKPSSTSELSNIEGIGPKKLELYGSEILRAVSKYSVGKNK